MKVQGNGKSGGLKTNEADSKEATTVVKTKTDRLLLKKKKVFNQRQKLLNLQTA